MLNFRVRDQLNSYRAIVTTFKVCSIVICPYPLIGVLWATLVSLRLVLNSAGVLFQTFFQLTEVI